MDFSAYLKSEEKSENTIEKYIRDVRAFAAYQNGAEVTKETVIAYKRNLLSLNYAVRSINSMLASINSLFSFLGWVDCRVKSIKLQRQIYCPEEKELTKAERLKHSNLSTIRKRAYKIKPPKSGQNEKLCLKSKVLVEQSLNNLAVVK